MAKKGFLLWLAGLCILPSTLLGRVADAVWYQGTVENAFKEAEKSKKPIFIYWGATWCPPCNEIKKEVFAAPDFAEIMKPFIAIYLDGDDEEAQIWGEKLGASGYPTILVLNTKGAEVVRLDHGLDFNEFKVAMAAALAQQSPLAQIIERLEKKEMSLADWPLLAYSSAEHWRGVKLSTDEKLNLFEKLMESVPPSMPLIKVQLQKKWLSQKIEHKNGEPLEPEEAHLVIECLNKMLESESGRMSLRHFIIFDSVEVMAALRRSGSHKAYDKLKGDLLIAARELVKNPQISLDLRLWASALEWSFFKLENDGQAVPLAMRQKIKAAVATADLLAKTEYERKSVIAGAAYLLSEVGDVGGAYDLLFQEQKESNTPWYYQSALAKLELNRGRHEQARLWSRRARDQARGRATKIQWAASDLLLQLDLKKKVPDLDIGPALESFYTSVFSQPDGFLGRNNLRAVRVAGQIAPLLKEPQWSRKISYYSSKCGGLSGSNQQRCNEHFKSLGL